ncbi:MAG: ribulose-phosphate 3-epimerase, partial [Clostridia bacterium]|nr:ribulose-phosphate 3-epimerase [Clostridia bacterium]
MFKRVSASFLCVDYEKKEILLQAVKDAEKAGCNFIHFDVMDGVFVKRKTFDEKLVNFVKENTNLMLDVHLMVENPEKVVDKYLALGVDILSFHYEATSDAEALLKKIKSKNVLAGIAINPKTPAYKIRDLVKSGLVDVVLVMGVEPGAAGQAFIPGSAEKVAEIHEYSRNVYIEIDGGVNVKNASILRKMGASILVSSSAIYNAKNMKKAVSQIKGNDYVSQIARFFSR